jgi:Zn-dependent protease/CBS domain-containing protein
MKMGGGFNLGKLFGIQVRLHYSWFIIFTLITWTLATSYFPVTYPAWSLTTKIAAGIITSLLFFASVLAHELAHSLVGRANGIPVKSITLFIFGGVAQMTREATKASAELKMSAAGPVCSLATGGVFGLFWILTRDIFEPVAVMAFYLAWVNVALAVFNLIPGFPLDGGRVFRSLVWRFSGNYQHSTRIATRLGQGVAYAFMVGGILWMFILHDWLSGLWLVFIGWFLQGTASMSYRQVQWREALHGLTASQMMTAEYVVVPPGITVSQLVQEYVLPRGYHLFLIAEGDRLRGILTMHNIKSVPQPKWDMTQVEKIMVPVERLKVASPDQDALSIAEQMEANEINQVPVVSEGRVMGLVTRDNLLRFLRTRTELRIKSNSHPGGRDD